MLPIHLDAIWKQSCQWEQWPGCDRKCNLKYVDKYPSNGLLGNISINYAFTDSSTIYYQIVPPKEIPLRLYPNVLCRSHTYQKFGSLLFLWKYCCKQHSRYAVTGGVYTISFSIYYLLFTGVIAQSPKGGAIVASLGRTFGCWYTLIESSRKQISLPVHQIMKHP